MTEMGEQLRLAMRRWVTGVAVVTSHFDGTRHGMTVNSLASISLEPPYVGISLANRTRTHALVMQAGIFGVTLLSVNQQEIADRFAGKMPEELDRFTGLTVDQLVSGAPVLRGGTARLDCKVVHTFAMPGSTLFIGEVLAAETFDLEPLIYYNRLYHRTLA